MKNTKYTLITPARNEEAFIQGHIEAVLSQTILPQRWIIVSNGSVDRTEGIVTEFARKHDWIELLRIEEPKGRKDFGAKVRAFRAGYSLLEGIPFDFVGNLDADVTFRPDYHEEILHRFQENPKLGLAGGIILEPLESGFVPQRTSLNSVCGAVQLFRREAYEAIGGYIPMRDGGVDAAAEIMVRMHGWEVQVFPEIPAYAQRPVSTGGRTVLNTRFRQGVANYRLGYHPLFQVASSLPRLLDKPYLIGSLSTLLGYGWSCLKHYERSLPDDVVRFLRAEQMGRLASPFTQRGAS